MVTSAANADADIKRATDPAANMVSNLFILILPRFSIFVEISLHEFTQIETSKHQIDGAIEIYALNN
jgi:hypothetical protein